LSVDVTAVFLGAVFSRQSATVSAQAVNELAAPRVNGLTGG